MYVTCYACKHRTVQSVYLYMLDAIYVGLAFGSFIVLALYVVGCEKL